MVRLGKRLALIGKPVDVGSIKLLIGVFSLCGGAWRALLERLRAPVGTWVRIPPLPPHGVANGLGETLAMSYPGFNSLLLHHSGENRCSRGPHKPSSVDSTSTSATMLDSSSV